MSKPVLVEFTWTEAIDTSSAVALAAMIMTQANNTPEQVAVLKRLQQIELRLDEAAKAAQPSDEERNASTNNAAHALIDAIYQSRA